MIPAYAFRVAVAWKRASHVVSRWGWLVLCVLVLGSALWVW